MFSVYHSDMSSPSVTVVVASVVGFVQGYLSIPTLFAVGPLARWVMRPRPGMEQHTFSRLFTIGVISVGLVLIHLAFALAWLQPLANSAAGESHNSGGGLELGKYWAGAVFGGMLLYAFLPARKAAGADSSEALGAANHR